MLLCGDHPGEGDGRYVYPRVVCVTDTSLFVSWEGEWGMGTVVKKYDFV
jgi:hypothetical protein